VKDVALRLTGVRVGPNWPMIVLLISGGVAFFVVCSLYISGMRGWGWVILGLLLLVVLLPLKILGLFLRSVPSTRGVGMHRAMRVGEAQRAAADRARVQSLYESNVPASDGSWVPPPTGIKGALIRGINRGLRSIIPW
jgi:hypothetical protein